MSAHPIVNIAQAGIGYWGKNLFRNFDALSDARIVHLCDADADVLARYGKKHPDMRTSTRFDDVLANPEVDAVVIATQTPLHFDFSRRALEAGKHVFVEKPLAQSAEQAECLVQLAEANDLRLMVGHLLMYHPAFTYVHDLIQNGALGEIRYLYSVRVNLGIVRKQENAFESLAPHDLSIALQFLDTRPVAVSATGQAFLQAGVEDVAFATVFFENGKMAHLHTSWLDPHKIRKVTVVGSAKMAVIDDTESTETVRLFDKGVNIQAGNPQVPYETYTEAMSIRSGDIVIPKIPMQEPLRLECQHFVDCVREGRTPLSDGRNGLMVVRLLEAAQTSLNQSGACVFL